MVANLKKRRMREIIFVVNIHRNWRDSLNYAGSIAIINVKLRVIDE